MAVETNARIEFSVASVEEWEKVNPKLHQGEPVFAKKPSGKYILKVGAPGGSTYKNAVVVWDQDDAETKMENTQTAAAEALASKNVASASASAAKTSETAAEGSKSAAAKSAANAKTSETNAAASKTAAANSASTASAKATAAGNSAIAAATSEKNAGSSASAAATSESNALKSANAAITSAGNAKTSETSAATSAKAAKQSEENAKTWDPKNYAKYNEIFPITDTGRLDLKGNILDLNNIKCLSTSSWKCLDSSYTAKIANCPTSTAFYLFNLRNGASSTSKNNTFTDLTSFYYYIVQVLIDIGGTVWVRNCFNSSTDKFTFNKWKQIVDTDITNALANKIPTKVSQLTNDSNYATTDYVDALAARLNILARNKSYAVGDIAYSPNLPSYLYLECTTAGTTGATEPDMSTVSGGVMVDDGTAKFVAKTVCAKEYVDAKVSDEGSKWKKAYNNLRKRSYPTEFDEDELTILLDTAMATGTLTLSKPYTNFDGLLIEYTDDNGNAFNCKYISTAELNHRIARSISIKGSERAATIALLSGEQYWRIWCGKSRGFTTTTFPVWAENCIIYRIYGVKFKEII